MKEEHVELLEKKCGKKDLEKLNAIKNPEIRDFIFESAKLCEPDSIFICSDSSEDISRVRDEAIASGEEKPFAIKGHTYHFDGISDQGRDRAATKYLVPENDPLSKALNQIEKEEGLSEVKGFLKDCMEGRTMIVRFLSLGPTGSPVMPMVSPS